MMNTFHALFCLVLATGHIAYSMQLELPFDDSNQTGIPSLKSLLMHQLLKKAVHENSPELLQSLAQSYETAQEEFSHLLIERELPLLRYLLPQSIRYCKQLPYDIPPAGREPESSITEQSVAFSPDERYLAIAFNRLLKSLDGERPDHFLVIHLWRVRDLMNEADTYDKEVVAQKRIPQVKPISELVFPKYFTAPHWENNIVWHPKEKLFVYNEFARENIYFIGITENDQLELLHHRYTLEKTACAAMPGEDNDERLHFSSLHPQKKIRQCLFNSSGSHILLIRQYTQGKPTYCLFVFPFEPQTWSPYPASDYFPVMDSVTPNEDVLVADWYGERSFVYITRELTIHVRAIDGTELRDPISLQPNYARYRNLRCLDTWPLEGFCPQELNILPNSDSAYVKINIGDDDYLMGCWLSLLDGTISNELLVHDEVYYTSTDNHTTHHLQGHQFALQLSEGNEAEGKEALVEIIDAHTKRHVEILALPMLNFPYAKVSPAKNLVYLASQSRNRSKIAGWKEPLTQPPLPQNVACQFPALRSSGIDLQHGICLHSMEWNFQLWLP